MTKAERKKIEEAIRLLIHEYDGRDDYFDKAMRILMPMVGLRRALWDLNDSKTIPIDQIKPGKFRWPEESS